MATKLAPTITDEDMYEALRSKSGQQLLRRALAEHVRYDRFYDSHLAEAVEAAFPAAAQARVEREKKEQADREAREKHHNAELRAWAEAVSKERAIQAQMEALRNEQAALEEAKLRAAAEKAVGNG